jgi:hypothetical protein
MSSKMGSLEANKSPEPASSWSRLLDGQMRSRGSLQGHDNISVRRGGHGRADYGPFHEDDGYDGDSDDDAESIAGIDSQTSVNSFDLVTNEALDLPRKAKTTGSHSIYQRRELRNKERKMKELAAKNEAEAAKASFVSSAQSTLLAEEEFRELLLLGMYNRGGRSSTSQSADAVIKDPSPRWGQASLYDIPLKKISAGMKNQSKDETKHVVVRKFTDEIWPAKIPQSPDSPVRRRSPDSPVRLRSPVTSRTPATYCYASSRRYQPSSASP